MYDKTRCGITVKATIFQVLRKKMQTSKISLDSRVSAGSCHFRNLQKNNNCGNNKTSFAKEFGARNIFFGFLGLT